MAVEAKTEFLLVKLREFSLRAAVDPSALRAMTEAMPAQPESAHDFVRRMRDDERC